MSALLTRSSASRLAWRRALRMIGTPLQRCISKRRVLSSPLTEVSTTPIISERDALKRLTALDKSVGRHDKLYYELSAPELSDAAYDELIAEATRIERAFPKLHGTVKKLRGVGFQPSDVFEQFPHIGPMLSLSNMFTLEDVTKFVARIQSKVAQGVDFPPPQFVIEPKIDGISLSLLYRAGTLSRAGTRGDGQTGEDVTPNVLLYVDDIPRVLSHPIAVENHIIEVRGEVYMSKQKLLDHNIREEVRDFSTARNAASGILRRKSARDILRDLGSPLNFFAYALYIHDSGDPTRVHTTQPAKTQAGVLANLLDLGFRVASLKDPMVTRWPALSSESTELHESSEDIYNSFINYENRRHLIPYDIDGAVVKLNDICSQSFLGCATRYPRWAAAIKFKSEQRVTKLRGITVQVGSKGALTPVAVLDAVMLGGVTVTRATLHNEDNVNRILGNELSGYTQFESDLNINVVVCRSGDVIPKVLGTVSNATVQHAVDSAKASSGIYRLPRHCPSCGSASERLGDDAAVTCSADQLTCPAQNLGAISTYCSKAAADIRGLSTSRLSSLRAMGLLSCIADLYKLGPALKHIVAAKMDKKSLYYSKENVEVHWNDRLLVVNKKQIQGWREKSTESLITAINSSRSMSSSRFLYGLGLRHVGENTSKDVIRHFGGFINLWKFVETEFISINIYENKGLGPTAQYLSVMINIPKLSTLAIQSIWNMVASPSMRKSIAALLEEVQFVDNASAETQSVNKAHTSTISYEGQANKLGSTNDKLEKLRDCIEGKTVVLTGVLFALDGKNRNEAIPRAAVASAILSLGGLIGKTVSKNTDILICGINGALKSKTTSSKLSKAMARNVAIWDESDERVYILREYFNNNS